MKLHFRTVWQVKIHNQHIWKYFMGEIISTLRLKEMQLFGQEDGEWITATGVLKRAISPLLHFPVFVHTNRFDHKLIYSPKERKQEEKDLPPPQTQAG